MRQPSGGSALIAGARKAQLVITVDRLNCEGRPGGLTVAAGWSS
jgi:hypothetical protein